MFPCRWVVPKAARLMPSPPIGERRGCACKEVAFPRRKSPKPLAETTQESQVKARYLVGRNFTYADIGGEYHDLLSHTNPPSYDFNNVSTIAVQLVLVGRKRFERLRKVVARTSKLLPPSLSGPAGTTKSHVGRSPFARGHNNEEPLLGR